MTDRVDAFVVVTPGLEAFALDEVVRLGVRPARAVRGGVECTVTWKQVWALNLRLRLATRVLVRVGSFAADGMGTLQAGLRRIDWSHWLPDGAVEVQATCAAGSGLFHSGAVEQRVRDAIGGARPDSHGGAPQAVLVRVAGGRVTVSLDSSGPPLYQRGWRGAAGRAPVRESLAAALLVAGGWPATSPLVDPFCGSGTVLIEAAQIARRMAAGRQRSFACQRWPSFDEAAWQRIIGGLDADVVDRCPPIIGSDRDAGAVAAARENAARAGVAEAIDVQHRGASEMVPPPGGRVGWVVANPPYGERIGAGRSLVPLYDAVGRALHDRFAGWHVALLAAATVPLGAVGLEWTETARTSNGGIPVRVACAIVGGAGTVPV